MLVPTIFRRRRMSAIRASVHETLGVSFNFTTDDEGMFAHRSGNGMYFTLVKIFDQDKSVEVQVQYEEIVDELVFTLLGPAGTEIHARRFPLGMALAEALVIARLMVKEYEAGFWKFSHGAQPKKVAVVMREKKRQNRMFDFT